MEAETQSSISFRVWALKQFDTESLSPCLVLNWCLETKIRREGVGGNGVPSSEAVSFNLSRCLECCHVKSTVLAGVQSVWANYGSFPAPLKSDPYTWFVSQERQIFYILDQAVLIFIKLFITKKLPVKITEISKVLLYWLWFIFRGGIIQSVRCTAAFFWFPMSPLVNSNRSWFIHQSFFSNTSRTTSN